MTFHNGKISMEPWIETASGGQFWFNKQNSCEEINIEDIAASLSKLCRFTGHCRRFYSVAEHSLYVSKLVPKEKALAGLLHEASEAYLADMASPVKQLLPDYRELEEGVMTNISIKFKLPYGFDKDKDIKNADWAQLKTEAEYLLPSQGKEWFFPEGLAQGFVPQGLDPQVVEKLFMDRYIELTGEFK